MNIKQNYKVFLQRNGKLLMFKKDDLYDGDSLNIERYINKGHIRYVYINKQHHNIEQTLYYFAKTSDQYLTQYGEWYNIEETINLPASPVVNAILKDYYNDGQYNNDIKIVTKNDDIVDFINL